MHRFAFVLIALRRVYIIFTIHVLTLKRFALAFVDFWFGLEGFLNMDDFYYFDSKRGVMWRGKRVGKV
jgi:hypothetical protein